jgi:lipid II:glycine glycyltransferase (peptidoglycan interpeptide bridge formation enzyme)
MVSFDKRFSVLTVHENWFDLRYKATDLFGLTAYMHVKDSLKKIPFGIKEASHTVENDLKQGKDSLFGNFSKDYRRQIRKAEEEGMECSFREDIDEFVRIYNEFAASKKVNLTSRQRIEEMKEFFQMSFVSYQGITLAAHSYLMDKDLRIVRAYHSATQRLSGEFDKNLVGRANKLLHYKDMLHYKELGYEIYDFGGYTQDAQDKGLQGINEFKLNFGGTIVSCNNYYTIPYFIVKKAAGALGMV